MISYDIDVIPVRSRFPIINLRFDKTGALRTSPTYSIRWFLDEGTVLLGGWTLTLAGDPGISVQTWDQVTKTGDSNVHLLQSQFTQILYL